MELSTRLIGDWLEEIQGASQLLPNENSNESWTCEQLAFWIYFYFAFNVHGLRHLLLYYLRC